MNVILDEDDELTYGDDGLPLDVFPPSWFSGEAVRIGTREAAAPIGERLLTAQEAARYVGCAANTVYDAAKAGRLSFCAIGRLRRFTVEDLDAWTRRES